MLFVYAATILISLGVIFEFLPYSVGEFAFTLTAGATAIAIFRLRSQDEDSSWSFSMVMFGLTALITTVANVAWVYGGFLEEFPVWLEFTGAFVWGFWALTFGLAISEGVFEMEEHPRLSSVAKGIAYLIAVGAGATLMFSAYYASGGDMARGLEVLDVAGSYVLIAALVPAAIVLVSSRKSRDTLPQLLIAAAIFVTFGADMAYLTIPEDYADMSYNAVATLFWGLIYTGLYTHVWGVTPLEARNEEEAHEEEYEEDFDLAN